jgi:7-alpha-hydroxysteroid dehydrogenase
MILDAFSLVDKVAIVTGAARGIGKGIALAFAESGANVVCVDLGSDGAEATAAEVRNAGRKALAVACDVTDNQQVESMVNRTVGEFGRIDILVNNAGGGIYCPAMKHNEKRWDATVRLNLTAAFMCSKAAAKFMLEQKSGSIINISSGNSQLPAPGMIAYAAAKAGINSITKTLAWELGPHVRVNCILPGAIVTEGSGPVLASVKDKLLAGTPRKRMGTPRDIALAAIFLASSASDFVTGRKVEVDGGLEFVALDPSEVGGQS